MTKKEFLSGVEFEYNSECRECNELYRVSSTVDGVVYCKKCFTGTWEYFCSIDKKTTKAVHGFAFLLGTLHKFVFQLDKCIPVATDSKKTEENAA